MSTSENPPQDIDVTLLSKRKSDEIFELELAEKRYKECIEEKESNKNEVDMAVGLEGEEEDSSELVDLGSEQVDLGRVVVEIGDDDSRNEDKDAEAFNLVQEYLFMADENLRARLFVDAVHTYGSQILEHHEDARDELILSACALDPDFAKRAYVAIERRAHGSLNSPVELSSDDPNDGEDSEDDEEDDDDEESLEEDEIQNKKVIPTQDSDANSGDEDNEEEDK